MKRYVLIGLGGALGAVSRFLIKGMNLGYHGKFPLNTLIINISGSLILAFILTVALEIWSFDEDVRLGIATGFIGAYTTFSTLCKETVLLAQQGFFFYAVLYVAVSTALGLLAAYLGMIVARRIVPRMLGIIDKNGEEDYDGGVE